MQMNSYSTDLVSHCIEFMSNKETVMSLFDEKRISYPKGASFKKLALAYEANPTAITVDEICQCVSEINGRLAITNAISAILSLVY